MKEQYFIIIRGLPGSGKSTIAKRLAKMHGFKHFEADMFMVDSKGNYAFDPKKLSECHEKCFDNAIEAAKNGHNVIVSNTFTRKWEMEKYIKAAKKLPVTLSIYHARGNYGSIHDVPNETMERMAERFEPFEYNPEIVERLLRNHNT